MNESEFENELRALRPAAPSATLVEKIARELRSETHAANGALARAAAKRAPTAAVVPRAERGNSAWLRGLLWICGGAAAAIAIVVSTRSPEPARELASTAIATTAQFEAGESTNELIDAEDEGLRYDEDQAPQRQLRLTYIERHTWTNPATGAVIEFEIPREDIVLMPVAMQ